MPCAAIAEYGGAIRLIFGLARLSARLEHRPLPDLNSVVEPGSWLQSGERRAICTMRLDSRATDTRRNIGFCGCDHSPPDAAFTRIRPRRRSLSAACHISVMDVNSGALLELQIWFDDEWRVSGAANIGRQQNAKKCKSALHEEPSLATFRYTSGYGSSHDALPCSGGATSGCVVWFRGRAIRGWNCLW